MRCGTAGAVPGMISLGYRNIKIERAISSCLPGISARTGCGAASSLCNLICIVCCAQLRQRDRLCDRTLCAGSCQCACCRCCGGFCDLVAIAMAAGCSIDIEHTAVELHRTVIIIVGFQGNGMLAYSQTGEFQILVDSSFLQANCRCILIGSLPCGVIVTIQICFDLLKCKIRGYRTRQILRFLFQFRIVCRNEIRNRYLQLCQSNILKMSGVGVVGTTSDFNLVPLFIVSIGIAAQHLHSGAGGFCYTQRRIIIGRIGAERNISGLGDLVRACICSVECTFPIVDRTAGRTAAKLAAYRCVAVSQCSATGCAAFAAGLGLGAGRCGIAV